MRKKILAFLPVFLIFIIGLLVFLKTFELEIFGDEWEALWWTKYGLETAGVYNTRPEYKPYELAAILLNVVFSLFSSNGSAALYILSFTSRFFASLALLYFLRRRGLSGLASLLGVIAFMVTPIGIQATDWAKNLTSYISITFFLLAVDQIHTVKSWGSTAIFVGSYLIAMFVNPIRAYGVIITIILLSLVKLIIVGKENRKYLFFLCLISIFLPMIFSMSSIFGTIPWGEYINVKSGTIIKLFQEQFFSIIAGLFGSLGNGLSPQSVFLMLAYIIFLFFWDKDLMGKKFIIYKLFQLCILGILCLIFLQSFKNFPTILGLYSSLILGTSFVLEIINKQKEGILNSLFLWCLGIVFIFLPWTRDPTLVYESTHRYLIYTALSLPIVMSFAINNIFKSFQRSKKSWIAYLLAIPIIVILFLSTSSEIEKMYVNHNKRYIEMLWRQILPNFKSFDFKKERAIITIDSDDPRIYSLKFGMGYHLAYEFSVWDIEKLPLMVDGVEDLKSMVTDGEASKKHINKIFIFPKEDAFYFQIIDNKVTRVDIGQI